MRIIRFFQLFIVFAVPFLFVAEETIQEEQILRHIHDHMIIKDYSCALREAEEGLCLYQNSDKMKEAYAEALAKTGKNGEAILFLQQNMPSRALLETIAWSVLKEGRLSSQYAVRLSSLIGSALTNDAKAIEFLLSALDDSSAIVRSVAVQLSMHYGDCILQEKLAHVFEKEKVFWVRMEMLRAFGQMRVKKMASYLTEIAASDEKTFEEKALAIHSLVNIYDKAKSEEVLALTQSPKAGLRQFGCQLAAHFEVKGVKHQICQLLQDPRPDVRIAALNALGLYFRFELKKEDVFPLLEQSLADRMPSVAITAAWVAMILQHPKAEAFFQHWLLHPIEKNRRLAAAALAKSGSFGVVLAQKMLRRTEDPCVAANLALGLLGQRVEVKKCCEILFDFLRNKNGLWSWDEKEGTLFQVLSHSDLRHDELIPYYPEAEDAMVTLRLLSFLAIEEDDRALEGLKRFLSHKHWGMSALAAITLLQEGGVPEAQLVRKLLQDPDCNLRCQAALALAFLAKDRSALPILIEAYQKADYELKERILEALGQIGSEESLPFLFQILKEPFLQLRVIAASSLIQCLNR